MNVFGFELVQVYLLIFVIFLPSNQTDHKDHIKRCL
jgi:hypothetical protein